MTYLDYGWMLEPRVYFKLSGTAMVRNREAAQVTRRSHLRLDSISHILGQHRLFFNLQCKKIISTLSYVGRSTVAHHFDGHGAVGMVVCAVNTRKTAAPNERLDHVLAELCPCTSA